MNKICIVGNGPNVMDRELGSTINSFDDIVRFNRSPIQGYEQFVGDKTTYRFINRTVSRNAKEHLEEDLNIVSTFRNMTLLFDDDNKGNVKLLKSIFHESCEFNFLNRKKELEKMLNYYNLGIKMNGKNPTGGLSIISYFLNKNYEITIHGFGLSDNRTLSVIPHFYESKTVITTHDYNYEVDIIEKLIYKNIINKL